MKMKRLSPNLSNLIVDEPTRSTFDPFESSGSLSFRESASPISDYCAFALRHCNAGSAVTAAYELRDHLRKGGKLFVTISGALSSFQVGRVLSELIRRGKVHGISATAANFEESFYRYVAHSHYKYIPRYTELTPVQEQELRDAGYRRITDTFLPEEESVRILEPHLAKFWKEAMIAGKSYLPHEYFFRLFSEKVVTPDPAGDPRNCWAYAAWEKGVHVVIPGFEDSTMGNIFASYSYSGALKPKEVDYIDASVMKSGISYMHSMYDWYYENAKSPGIGFLQLGGGIAGDFPICVVPSLKHDLHRQDILDWASFTEIGSSPMSYGSYSGAGGKEKITWDKLSVESQYTIIQSDATIVFPLIGAILLEL
jgi:deoxyhypusine synthase